VIPNGVDLSLFMPQRDASIREHFGIEKERFLLLAVASPFDRRKGFDDIIKMGQQLQGKATVIMVGLTEKQMRGLPRFIIGIKKTDGPESLVQLYSGADCFVNASYEETYPTVNMEAAACGTPVATYDSSGCAEQIAPTIGCAVRTGNIQALSEAALMLSRTKTERSAACRAHAEKYFDREEAVSAYLREYNSFTFYSPS